MGPGYKYQQGKPESKQHKSTMPHHCITETSSYRHIESRLFDHGLIYMPLIIIGAYDNRFCADQMKSLNFKETAIKCLEK